MAYYNSYNSSSGNNCLLITPAFDLSAGQGQVSFWMYRDPGYATTYDSIGVWVNTSSSMTGAVPLGNIWRYSATANWYKFTYSIPPSFNGSTNYLIFRAWSALGDNMFLDDVSYGTPPPMAYTSSTTTQTGGSVAPNSINNQIIGMQVVTTGSGTPLNLTQLNLTTSGSTNPANDIRNGKIFYTGTSNTFAATTQFGTTVTNPNGSFNVTGSQALQEGTNYFWLTYDVPLTGTLGNQLDATCEQIIGSGSMGTVVPVPTAPAGYKTIAGPMSGTYVVGLGQTSPNFPTITSAVSDLALRGINGAVTFLVKPGIYGTDAGLEIDSTLTINAVTGASATNTVTFKRKSDEAGMVWVERRGTALTTDFIFNLNGASFLTFDSINVRQKDTTLLYSGVEFGYYLTAASPTAGSQYNTIRNCNISLNKSNTVSKGIYQYNALTPTSSLGTNSYNQYYSNNISNVFSGIYLVGYAAAFPYILYDQNTQVGTNGGNTITNWGAGSAPYGVYATYQKGLVVANNTITHSSALSTGPSALYFSTGASSNLDVYNNTITYTALSTSSYCYGIYNSAMGSTALGNHVNIYNNNLSNWTLSTNIGSSSHYMIYSGASADTVNIYNNNLNNDSIGGTGTVYTLYQAGSANTINIYGNTINNMYRSGGSFVYGIYNGSSSATLGVEKIYNNTISNIGSPSTSSLYLMYLTSAPINRYLYGNNINNCYTGSGTLYGIYQTGGVNNFIYNNNVNNLTSNNASATVYGIYNGSGTYVYTYNNFISNLKTPVSTSLTSAYGLFLGSPVTYLGAFYNSIYLNATSSSTTFGNVAVYISSSATNVIDLRNNNIVNNSTPGTSGRTVGIRYTSVPPYTNYFVGSGANNIYMGSAVPVSLRSFFYDGTNSDSSLIKFQNRVSPREQSSVSENPTFANSVTGDLHMSGASLLKQGGYPVTSVPIGPAFSVTTDIDGQTRGASFTDIGADEFTGTRIAGTAPSIAYTVLGNGNTSNRTLANVTIVDPEGVDNTNKPRVYYKKSINANTFNDNTSATDGWKYAVTSSASSPYSFTIDYTLLLGGTVSLGDSINYFVVAQDLAGTPNVGINAGGFTALPTSVNLTSAAFPVTGFNKYAIAGSLSAGITVGTGGTYPSLTGAGGLFAAMNAGELTGNLTVDVISDLTETGVNALNQWSEQAAANLYTLTIKSSDTATYVRTISGWVANSMIRFNGPSGVTINGGTGKYLRFRQKTVAQPTFLLTNGTQNVTIKNCNIEGSNTSTTVGLISLTTANTTLGLGNSNITFDNNNISARSDTGLYLISVSLQ